MSDETTARIAIYSQRAAHPVQIRVSILRGCLRRRHHADFDEIEQHLDHLDREVAQLLALARANDRAPARITLTATTEGTPMTTFAPGQTITFAAVSDNAEGAPVGDTYTWATTAGTIVAGADTTTVTISDAPLGDVTVTATDPAGLSGSVTVTVADQTPATVTVTAS